MTSGKVAAFDLNVLEKYKANKGPSIDPRYKAPVTPKKPRFVANLFDDNPEEKKSSSSSSSNSESKKRSRISLDGNDHTKKTKTSDRSSNGSSKKGKSPIKEHDRPHKKKKQLTEQEKEELELLSKISIKKKTDQPNKDLPKNSKIISSQTIKNSIQHENPITTKPRDASFLKEFASKPTEDESKKNKSEFMKQVDQTIQASARKTLEKLLKKDGFMPTNSSSSITSSIEKEPVKKAMDSKKSMEKSHSEKPKTAMTQSKSMPSKESKDKPNKVSEKSQNSRKETFA